MKNDALKNVAYSPKYKEQYKQYESLFLEENRQESQDIVLSDGYKIAKTTYAGKVLC